MTPQEKAKATRQEHKDAAKKRLAERNAERELIRKNLIAVLQSEDATPAERLESSKILLELDNPKTGF